MSVPVKTWPSVPMALAAALREKFGTGSTRLTYPYEYPAVQVTRAGGSDDGFTDRARVDVLVMATNEDDAESLAEAIRSHLVDTQPIRGAGLLLDGAATEVAPRRVYSDENVVEYLATYVVESRRF